MDSAAYSSRWAVCGWHSFCTPEVSTNSWSEFATHAQLSVGAPSGSNALWPWLLGAIGLKFTFAAGFFVGLFLGCAVGALFRSYFMLFQLAFALGVLGLVWII